MKKRIIILTAVVALILTGCGGNTEYQDAQVYYDMYINKTKEIDEDLIPTLEELLLALDVTDQIEVVEDKLIKDYNEVFNKFKKQDLKTFYENFSTKIDEATTLESLNIYTNSDTLKKILDNFNNAKDTTQAAYQKFYHDILEVYNEALDSALTTVKDTDLAELQEKYEDLQQLIEEILNSEELTTKREEIMQALYDAV